MLTRFITANAAKRIASQAATPLYTFKPFTPMNNTTFFTNTTTKRHFALHRGRPTPPTRPRVTRKPEDHSQQQQQQQYPPQQQYQQYPPEQQYQHNGQYPPQQYQQQYPPQQYQQGQYPPQQYQQGQHPPQQYQQGQGQYPQQYQQQQQPPPSVGSSIGMSILDGLTFGLGSSLAHRAIDSFWPRTMTVEHVGGVGADAAAAGAAGSLGGAAAGAGVGDIATGTGSPDMQGFNQEGGYSQNWQPDPQGYQQQEWQQPEDPYGQPPSMFGGGSWEEQNDAAEEAAGGGNGLLGTIGGFFKDE